MVTADAIYRDDNGAEHVVEWVTQQDVDLARRISTLATDHGADPDPASVSVVELGLDTTRSATIAPGWAALLTRNADFQGHGSPSDEICDATGRVSNLWFGGDDNASTGQWFHVEVYVEVYVAPEAAEQRITAAVAAGGTVVDDSNTPALTVIADQDGNKGILCVAHPTTRRTEPDDVETHREDTARSELHLTQSCERCARLKPAYDRRGQRYERPTPTTVLTRALCAGNCRSPHPSTARYRPPKRAYRQPS